MSDYLQNLAARTDLSAPTLRPRLAARFEPQPGVNVPQLEEVVEAPISAAPREDVANLETPPGATVMAPVSRRQPPTLEQSAAAPATILPAASRITVPDAVPERREAPFRPERETMIWTREDSPKLTPRVEPPTSQPKPDVPLVTPRVTQRIERAPRLEAAPVAAAPTTPTIRVTIGRVEVRAVMPPAPVAAPPHKAVAPTLSLEDYAKQRREGRR